MTLVHISSVLVPPQQQKGFKTQRAREVVVAASRCLRHQIAWSCRLISQTTASRTGKTQTVMPCEGFLKGDPFHQLRHSLLCVNMSLTDHHAKRLEATCMTALPFCSSKPWFLKMIFARNFSSPDRKLAINLCCLQHDND
jgi:hypothetical protein